MNSDRKHAWMLGLLWVCFLLRGVFYCFLFPLWEGYDEYPHFAFVQYATQHRSLPQSTTPVSREVEESLKLVPLPWLLRDIGPPHLTHDDYWRLPAAERARRQEQLLLIPREWQREPARDNARYLTDWEAQQPPLYYWLLSLPLRAAGDASLPARVVTLRLLSIALASFTIPAAFLAARGVLRSDKAALCVVALIAAMPELMVDICRVGNDGLALLSYSLLICAVIKFGQNPGKAGITGLIALSLGLGLLTKAYFLTALPALVVIVAWQAFRSPGARVKILCCGGFAVAAALAISGWWYWRNHALTGSWSGLMQDVALAKTPFSSLTGQVPRVDWKSAIDSLLFSHLWFGNWSFLQVRSWIYHAFEWALVPAFAGLSALALSARLRRKAPDGFYPSLRDLLVPAVFYAFFWLGLLYHVLITYVTKGISASAGWYLYCHVVAEVLVIVSGLLVISPGRLRGWVMPAAIISFVVLDLYTVHFLFIPYYTGLIAHQASGALAAFHVGLLRSVDVGEYLARMTVNKPWIHIPGFLAIWALYLVGTLVLVAVSISLARKD